MCYKTRGMDSGLISGADGVPIVSRLCPTATDVIS